MHQFAPKLKCTPSSFDARAYRFEEFRHGVKVFEIDHPATQLAKLKKLRRIFGQVPEHVVYVPIDFNTQTLAQRLPDCGYDERAESLFIWQGVTQYLTPEAVDSTLAFVANHSGAGTSIIFDYMYTSLLDGPVKHGEVAKMRRDRWLRREALTFGIPEGTVEAFLDQRGYYGIRNADQRRLHDLYFSEANAQRTVAYGYAIVSAVVKPRNAEQAIAGILR